MPSLDDLKGSAGGIISEAFRFSVEPPVPEGSRVSWTVREVGWSARFDFEVRWRGLVGRFAINGFARPLVARAWAALSSSELVPLATEGGFSRLTGGAELLVNGAPPQVALQSGDKLTFALSATFSPFAAHQESGDLSVEDVSSRMSSLFTFVAALLPELGASELQLPEEVSLQEGASINVSSKRVERSRVAREICIAVHGASCSVCGINFGLRYGALGVGFIHVHHLKPLAGASGARLVDPVRDLVPVCPNCHAMLHRQAPPITPEQLRLVLTENANPSDG